MYDQCDCKGTSSGSWRHGENGKSTGSQSKRSEVSNFRDHNETPKWYYQSPRQYDQHGSSQGEANKSIPMLLSELTE